jgi:hypothetical protein
MTDPCQLAAILVALQPDLVSVIQESEWYVANILEKDPIKNADMIAKHKQRNERLSWAWCRTQSLLMPACEEKPKALVTDQQLALLAMIEANPKVKHKLLEKLSEKPF